MIFHLHGKLAEHIGRETWDLKVDSVAEGLRAIEANTDKFFHYLADSHYKKIAYEVIVDEETCENVAELGMNSNTQEVHIIPRLQTGKGIVKVIIGIVLIWIAWYVIPNFLGPSISGGFGGATVAEGAVLTATQKFALFAARTLATIGASLVLGGLYELIAGTPETPELGDDNSSYLFSGAVNTVKQGNPVPIAYGEVIVGSQVVNFQVTNKPGQTTTTNIDAKKKKPSVYARPIIAVVEQIKERKAQQERSVSNQSRNRYIVGSTKWNRVYEPTNDSIYTSEIPRSKYVIDPNLKING